MTKKHATDLRSEAAWRACQVRATGCTGGPCVLAHVRMNGISGLGIKAPDALGAWACDNCHKLYDVHGSIDRIEIENDFLKGVIRTQNLLIKEGKLKW